MSFTAAELAEMAAADAEIEAEFTLTAEEIRESRDLDRFAVFSAKDNRQRSIAEYQRQYYAANKEAFAERQRRYYAANKEAIAEYQRRYYAANKEAIAERQRRYRAAKKAAAKCSSCDYRRALATLADAQVMGADCPRFGTEECQQMDRRTQNGM